MTAQLWLVIGLSLVAGAVLSIATFLYIHNRRSAAFTLNPSATPRPLVEYYSLAVNLGDHVYLFPLLSLQIKLMTNENKITSIKCPKNSAFTPLPDPVSLEIDPKQTDIFKKPSLIKSVAEKTCGLIRVNHTKLISDPLQIAFKSTTYKGDFDQSSGALSCSSEALVNTVHFKRAINKDEAVHFGTDLVFTNFSKSPVHSIRKLNTLTACVDGLQNLIQLLDKQTIQKLFKPNTP
jgi:hypothetical protein